MGQIDREGYGELNPLHRKGARQGERNSCNYGVNM